MNTREETRIGALDSMTFDDCCESIQRILDRGALEQQEITALQQCRMALAFCFIEQTKSRFKAFCDSREELEVTPEDLQSWLRSHLSDCAGTVVRKEALTRPNLLIRQRRPGLLTPRRTLNRDSALSYRAVKSPSRPICG